ncbi:MAG: hypothetical protein ABI947_20580 [Chloroflexota bacterium]
MDIGVELGVSVADITSGIRVPGLAIRVRVEVGHGTLITMGVDVADDGCEPLSGTKVGASLTPVAVQGVGVGCANPAAIWE